MLYSRKRTVLLYQFLKWMARFAIRIFCREIIVNKPDCLREKGPLLLASNHPNSFLDSIIIDTLFEEPVWSLARGDVFTKPVYIRLLHKLKILPIYRKSEGAEKLPKNYKTFEDCLEIFRNKGVVMIFSEAKSINEWHLRPLKKGTARLAFKTWDAQIPLRILPVGINYSSFKKFGKNVFINFGTPIIADAVPADQPDGTRHQLFNQALETQLRSLVFEIDTKNKDLLQKKLERKPSLIEKILLAFPALLGWIAHLPLYLPLRQFTRTSTTGSDHYDSVLTALLFVLYPFYLLLCSFLTFYFTGNYYSWCLLFVLPVFAWSYVKLKRQMDR